MPPERTSSGFGQTASRRARAARRVAASDRQRHEDLRSPCSRRSSATTSRKLPGGIFGRAFVRSYAIEVGLDPETTIQEFIAQFPNDSVTAGHPASDQVEDHVAVESDRRTAGTFLWLMVIAVPIAGGAAVLRDARPRGAAHRRAGGRGRHATPRPPAARRRRPPIAAPPPPTAASAAAVPAPAHARPPTADVGARGRRPPADRSADVALTAKRPCWVSATVDGQKTIERLLQPGEQQTLDGAPRDGADRRRRRRRSRCSSTAPTAAPLGKSGEVVTARFTLTNYKDYLQAR